MNYQFWESDLEKAMSKTEAGKFIGYNDIEEAKSYIEKCYADFKENKLNVVARNLEQFDSKALTKQFCSLMN